MGYGYTPPGGGGGGTFEGVHNDLDGRTTAGAHPATALTTTTSGLPQDFIDELGATPTQQEYNAFNADFIQYLGSAITNLSMYEVPLIPGIGFAFILVSDVDGTATTITFILPDPDAELDEVIPEGWAEVATVPVGSIPAGTYTLVVPTGEHAGVYTVDTTVIDDPWPVVDVEPGTFGFADNEAGFKWLAVKTLTGWGSNLASFSAITLAKFVRIGTMAGLFAPRTGYDLDSVLGALEAFLDRRRYVDHIVHPDAITASGAGSIATMTAGAVLDADQPEDIDGVKIGKGKRIGFLGGFTALDGLWYGTTDASTGQLSLENVLTDGTIPPGAGTNRLVGGCNLIAPTAIAFYDRDGGSALAAPLGQDGGEGPTDSGTWRVIKTAV